ncbi:MAG TPA: hypothetical protein DC015_14935 [Aequorivita sp.]|nr:hypothetical protein [Aequorivita sp.]HBC05449.1 hypothetical protein [Aequorivita sp.]
MGILGFQGLPKYSDCGEDFIYLIKFLNISIMKKVTLIFLTIFAVLQSFAQNPDPELFKTWNLYKMEFDFGGPLYIEDIDPPIHPTLTIFEDLSFEGFGACNSFSGNFLYDEILDKLRPYNYSDTTEDCETEFHDDFELYYFEYFSLNQAHFYGIEISSSDNLQHLYFGQGQLGYWLDFIAGEPLSIKDNNSEKFKLYPNPASDQLFIKSEDAKIIKTIVYSVSGKRIMEIVPANESINIAVLAKGMYFLEITTSEGKSVEKFIKK